MEKETIIRDSIDDLDDIQLEQAITDFLIENKLVGEFVVWAEKWKQFHRIDGKKEISKSNIVIQTAKEHGLKVNDIPLANPVIDVFWNPDGQK